MKRILIILVAVILLIVGGYAVSVVYGPSLPGTGDTAGDAIVEDEAPEAAVYQKIDPEEAKRIMDSGDPYILLDVRTPEEFAEEHIAGATLIPIDEVIERSPLELPDKDALIFVYCRSGNRSFMVVNELAKMGYANVYDLGGIIDWPY